MLFSYVGGQQQIGDNKNAGNLLVISIAMRMQRCNARCIAQWSTSRLHSKPLDAAIERVPAPYRPGGHHGWRFRLASNYSTFQALVIRENLIPQNGPSTQLIDATSFV